MNKSRYSESQIVKILKEVEGGRLVKEVCREYGISDATYYNWKSKYGGMEASDVKRLKEGDSLPLKVLRLDPTVHAVREPRMANMLKGREPQLPSLVPEGAEIGKLV